MESVVFIPESREVAAYSTGPGAVSKITNLPTYDEPYFGLVLSQHDRVRATIVRSRFESAKALANRSIAPELPQSPRLNSADQYPSVDLQVSSPHDE